MSQVACRSRAHPVCANRPSRRPTTALKVVCLHKALDQKVRTGPLASPEEVTFECLTALRRPDLESLVPMFPPSYNPSRQQAVLEVGGQRVVESGPLACCSDFMDCAARRVLPGHLLRRCRVLSSVQIGNICQQRVTLTACTGEESIFTWRMRRVAPPPEEADTEAPSPSSPAPPASSSSSPSSSGSDASAPVTSGEPKGAHTSALVMPSSSGAGAGAGSSSDSDSESGSSRVARLAGLGSLWMIESITRDESMDEEALPPRPHPRAAPEVVIKAQLAALRRGDVPGAAAFNLWSRSTSGGWELHLHVFRNLLRQQPHHALLTHASAELGAAAMPSPRHMLIEVTISQPRSGLGVVVEQQFVWQMVMTGMGCWAVEAIRTADNHDVI